MKSSVSKKSFGAISIFGFVFIGMGLTVFSLVVYEKARIVFGGYTQVNGYVVESYVKNTTIATGGKRTRAYDPIIKYNYQVNGITYHSSNTDSKLVSAPSGEGGRAHKAVSKYPRGAVIEVWHKTDAPNFSVVDVEKK